MGFRSNHSANIVFSLSPFFRTFDKANFYSSVVRPVEVSEQLFFEPGVPAVIFVVGGAGYQIRGIGINETVFGQPIEWNSPKIVGRQFDMGIFDGFGKMPHFVPHVVIEVAFPHRKIEFSFFVEPYLIVEGKHDEGEQHEEITVVPPFHIIQLATQPVISFLVICTQTSRAFALVKRISVRATVRQAVPVDDAVDYL